MLNAWPTKKLGDLLDYEQPGKYIVSSKNYSGEYKTPVLTAGKTFILGNTNEKENIFPVEKLPVIIFDDFTTAIKIVDFPFKVKSSAMKILHAKKDIADIKFLFYAMQTTGLDHATHKRYWISEYSKIEISLPPLAIQKKIVKKIEELFAKIDEAERLRKEAQKDSAALIPAALNKIFLEGKKKGWSEKRLDNLLDTLIPPKKIKKKDFKRAGKYPIIDQSQNEISGWTDDSSSLMNIKKPVIIFGDHTCAIKYSEKPFAQGADGIKILTAGESISPRFLYLILKNQSIKSEGYRRHFYKLKKLKIPVPSLSEQKKIVAYLDSLSEKVRALENMQSQTAADFSALRQSILHSAFQGELVK